MKKKLSFSILGDSYSTYKGWIPEGYATWYGDGDTNIDGVEETWWHLLMSECDLSLLGNYSYSGGTVCTTGYPEITDALQAFIVRMKEHLGEKNISDPKPDILFVEGGINDTFASPAGTLQYEGWTEEDLKNSLPAYCYMLDYLKRHNPDTRIICMISYIVSPELREGYTEACRHYQVEYLYFPPKDSDTELLNDGHPTTQGHRAIYETVRKYMDDTSSQADGQALQ